MMNFLKSICDQLYEKNTSESNSLNLTLNKDLVYSEVVKQVRKAKRNKALGLDGIPNEVLKI